MAPLAWIGRQRTRAVAGLLVIAIALPPLGAVLRPYVAVAVVALLCTAFMRLDVEAFRAHLRRPRLILAAAVWSAIGIPLLTAAGCLASGIDTTDPDLFLAMMLQTVTPPMMAAPAIVAIMGLDATLVLAALIATTVLTPLTAPVIAAALGVELALSPVALGLKLFAILAGSAIVGLTLRRILGVQVISDHRDKIDGLNILFLFVFVSAVMGDIGIRFLEAPGLVALLTVLGLLVYLVLMASTYLAFLKAGAGPAFALATMTAQRNMGLMIAATSGLLPDVTWLYFAVSQFPIYFAPLALQPLTRRLTAGRE